MSELKPCPFCGKEELRARSSGVMNYYMECEYCGASGPVDDTDLASENEWNTRASPWISLEDDKLPVPDKDYRAYSTRVLAYTPIETVEYRILPAEFIGSYLDITHWMPLPEKPA